MRARLSIAFWKLGAWEERGRCSTLEERGTDAHCRVWERGTGLTDSVDGWDLGTMELSCREHGDGGRSSIVLSTAVMSAGWCWTVVALESGVVVICADLAIGDVDTGTQLPQVVAPPGLRNRRVDCVHSEV